MWVMVRHGKENKYVQHETVRLEVLMVIQSNPYPYILLASKKH